MDESGKNSECWFEIEAPRPGIKSIVVGKDSLGFKIDIHGANPDDQFAGSDSLQDRVSHVIKILESYIGPESKWVDYGTREPIHVWDAMVALSDLEEL